MDTLSHIVLGAAIGEAMLGRKIGKKALLWGAVANNLADADVFFAPFFPPQDALLIHRGITHSFFFVLVMTPLLGWCFARIFSRYPAGITDWMLMFFIGLLAHPLLDSCTMYGTGLFEPFGHYRAEFTSLFIIDPLYTLPLLIGFIALLILRRDHPRRKFWTRFGLYLSTIYLTLCIGNKLYVGKIFTESLHKQQLHFTQYSTFPTPFNTILWNVIAKDTNGFWVGYYSHFDHSKDIRFFFVPKNDSLAGELAQTYPVLQLIRFSKGYYCFTRKAGKLYINDLRFAFAGQFSAEAKDFAFSFGIVKDPESPYGVKIERNPWSRSRFKGLSCLVERIKGI